VGNRCSNSLLHAICPDAKIVSCRTKPPSKTRTQHPTQVMLFDRGEVRTNNKKIIDLLQNSGWTQFSSSILDCKRLLIRMLSTSSKLAILVLITDKLNSIQPLFRCREFKFGHVWSPAWKLYSLTQSNQPWWHLKLILTCIYVRFVINTERTIIELPRIFARLSRNLNSCTHSTHLYNHRIRRIHSSLVLSSRPLTRSLK